MQVYSESRSQRCREQSAACRGPHEREWVEVYLYRPCRRSFVYHYVYAIVLHGGIQVFLHDRRQTVYLVDEEHVVGLQRCQYAGEVARFVEHRTARYLESHSQFVGNDVAERRLSQSWRSVQQRVVERFAAVFRRLYEHLQVFHHLLLSAEVTET